MKWKEGDFDKVKELYLTKHSYKEIALLVGRTFQSVRNKLINEKIKAPTEQKIIKECLACNKELKARKKFCSHSCSASWNNKLRGIKSLRICICCSKIVNNRMAKFCSISCSVEHKKEEIIKRIESGDPTIKTPVLKRYLIEKYGEKCMECGWDRIHPTLNKVPIELEHIDGNYKNNTLENGKLLCPNCHSLTLTYKALNYGNGRTLRDKNNI